MDRCRGMSLIAGIICERYDTTTANIIDRQKRDAETMHLKRLLFYSYKMLTSSGCNRISIHHYGKGYNDLHNVKYHLRIAKRIFDTDTQLKRDYAFVRLQYLLLDPARKNKPIDETKRLEWIAMVRECSTFEELDKATVKIALNLG
jgi:hypothetical protein